MTEPRLRPPDDRLSAEAWQQLENVYDRDLGINPVDRLGWLEKEN